MEYPCALVRLYDDGQVEIDKDLFMAYPEEINLSKNGYITLLMDKEICTEIYVVGSSPGICQAYLEGFLIGRNLDYVSRETFLDAADYQKLVNSAFSKLKVNE